MRSISDFVNLGFCFLGSFHLLRRNFSCSATSLAMKYSSRYMDLYRCFSFFVNFFPSNYLKRKSQSYLNTALRRKVSVSYIWNPSYSSSGVFV
jgi:hypothetical protein